MFLAGRLASILLLMVTVTTYTTIGYGNITAKTNLGKLAAMVSLVPQLPV